MEVGAVGIRCAVASRILTTFIPHPQSVFGITDSLRKGDNESKLH